MYGVAAHLLVKLLSYSLGPGSVEVKGLGGRVDVGHLDDHLHHQQPVNLG